MTAAGTGRKLDLNAKGMLTKLLLQQFKNKIVGQDKAVEALVNIFETHQAGFVQPNKPVGSLLFLGGTGAGKTYLCETFAESLFGNRKACLRIDCAEFIHSHEIAKLIGSPAGYLGHRETPAALNQKRLDQYHTAALKMSIILVDEIEKASDALWDLLLGVLDNATLTLGTNEVVDFSKTIIVMTSNLGSREMMNRGLGFAEPTDVQDQARLEQIALSAAKSKFRPEFMNRLNGVVMFRTLTQEQIAQVLDIELEALAKQLHSLGSDKQFTLVVSPKAKRTLISEGFDKTYGARCLKRTIERRITQPLAKLATSGQIMAEDTVVVDDTNGVDFDFWVHPTAVPKVAEARPTFVVEPVGCDHSIIRGSAGSWVCQQCGQPVSKEKVFYSSKF